MALTRNKPRTYSNIARGNTLPLAAATSVLEGAAVGIHAATGRARPLVAGDLFAGFAAHASSSVADVAGASPTHVQLHAEGEVLLTIAGLMATSIGASVFASDDDTFALTGTSLVGEILRLQGAQAVVGFSGGRLRMSSGQVASGQALVSEAGTARVQSIGLMGGQPLGIVRPVRSGGALVADFGAGKWLSASEGTNHTSTQGYTGFDGGGNVTGVRNPCGLPESLRVVCNNDTATSITLQTPATNILTALVAGKLMLVCTVENMPQYGPGGTGSVGLLSLDVTTAAGSFSQALTIGWNSNQVREGLNFLKFVQRNPAAYQSTSPATEYHPFGVIAGCYNTGSAANIVATAVAGLRLATQNLNGATVTFHAIWTGWDHLAQVVLGCDAVGNDLLQYGVPRFDEYGWKGYVASAARIWSSGSKILPNMAPSRPSNLATVYGHGWDCVNHSTNHIRNGDLTNASEIDYEITAVQSLYSALGTLRGNEFYASPQSSSSRLSDAVIAARGIRLQRHARKSNVSVTQWGIDNPHHVGALDLGNTGSGGVAYSAGPAAGSIAGWAMFSKIKRFIDVLEAYGDTGFPFWHGISELGDSGSGEDIVPGSASLIIARSAFDKTLAYIAEREAAGGLRVRDGITGFFYGTGR